MRSVVWAEKSRAFEISGFGNLADFISNLGRFLLSIEKKIFLKKMFLCNFLGLYTDKN